MNSIRGRLRALTTLTALGAYLLVSAALFVGVRQFLLGRLDAALRAKADLLATLVREETTGLDFEFDDTLMPEFSRADLPEYFELSYPDGKPWESSLSLQARGLPLLRDERPLPDAFSNGTLPDGREGHAVVVALHAQPSEDKEGPNAPVGRAMVLRLAVGTDEVARTLRLFAAGLALGGVALTLLVIAGTSWAVRRGLAPLTRLAEEVQAITPDTASAHFAAGAGVAELAGIRKRLDELVERLGSALARERRFTSAAAHELRTPLAELKTMGQVATRWPEESELRARMPAEVAAIAARMQRTVESLLALARAKQGQEVLEAAELDLARTIENVLERLALSVRSKSLRIETSLAPALALRSDPALVEAIVQNLVQNALQHSPAAEAICLRAGRVQQRIWFEVENANSALVAADLEHLFEPFWRKDPARSEAGSAGLGLALVAAWCELLGGTIEAELVFPSSIVFRLELPDRDRAVLAG